MLKLQEVRSLYPEYNKLTDHELSTALHQSRYAQMPYEEFAKGFGGPLEEDKAEVAAREYNAVNPNNKITVQDIRNKDRSGILGGLQLLGEGIYDAVTDQFPEDMARIWRGGDVDPSSTGMADDVIKRQRQDSAARIPSLQEAEGSILANSLYQGPKSIATSMATGLTGAVMGGAAGSAAGPAGTMVGSMVGGGALSGAAFYRMAKDQFVDEVQQAMQTSTGRTLSSEEAVNLNAAIDADASEFGLWEAGPEAISQFFTLGLIKGAGGAVLKNIGLGGVADSIGKRAITRVPAKLAAELAEEETTEATTYFGQEGIRQRYGLRPDAPTLGEFANEQAGPVAVGAVLQLGGMRAAQALGDRMQRRSEDVSAGESDAEGSAKLALPQAPLSLPEPPIAMGAERDKAAAIPMEAIDRFLPEEEYESTKKWVQEQERLAKLDHLPTKGFFPAAADAGETIDLLAWRGTEENPVFSMDALPAPKQNIPLPMAGIQSLLGLPAGSGAMPMGTQQTGRGAIAPPTSFAHPPIAPSYVERPALPMQSTQGTPQGRWAGGRSQLAYGPKPAQGINGMFAGQQQAAMPTQAQINSTQEAPRADTMAQADALGMPAPQAMPQEARDALPLPPQAQVQQVARPVSDTRPAAVQSPRDGLESLSRAKLLDMLPKDLLPKARRMNTPSIREMIRTKAKENTYAQVQAETETPTQVNDFLPEVDMQGAVHGATSNTTGVAADMSEKSALSGVAPVVKFEPQKQNIQQTAQVPTQEADNAGREARSERGSDSGNKGAALGQRKGGNGQGADGEFQQASVQERGVQREGQKPLRGEGDRPDGHGGMARRDQSSAGSVRGNDNTGRLESEPQEKSGGQRSSVQGRSVSVKVPGKPDLPVAYELVEADAVQASHLAQAGFQKNPHYALENERRYHDEPGSKAKVLENALRLDPAFLLSSVDANHGAPVVDQQGNVLGGNGRAMSIQYAYEGAGKSATAYRDALRVNADALGLNPSSIESMERPMLVRRVNGDMSPEVRQALVTAMNDDFKDSREKKSEGITRGERLSPTAITMLAEGMKAAEAGSLREFFDSTTSLPLVDKLMQDGVLQKTERNALVAADGLLNPDGKTKVEAALRVLYVNGRETLSALPDGIKAKMDVALPHMLLADNVGGEWAILQDVREANDLIVAYKGSGHKEVSTFLNQVDMMQGKSPAQGASPVALGIFTRALEDKKAEFTEHFKRYAKGAELSGDNNALAGVGKPRTLIIEERFGVKLPAELKQEAKGKPVASASGAAPQQKEATKNASVQGAGRDKIQDFGEKIGGARKDVWTEWRKDIGNLSKKDVIEKPLEKIFPEPKYDKLLSEGVDPKALALVHAVRDVVAEQKRSLRGRKQLADSVRELVEAAAKLLDSKEYYLTFVAGLQRNARLRGVHNAASLYEAVGHAKSLSGVRIAAAEYSVLDGERFNPPKTFWTVEKEAKKSAFSNWPRVLAKGETREEAVENFKKVYDNLQITKPAKKEVSFILYHDRGKALEIMIGVKIGRNYVPLAGPFSKAAEARSHLAENKEALIEKLDRMKNIPAERRDVNNPRVGEDMRGGQDVTPEMFTEAFGFRGVEFGNWVESDRRQVDLNNAYDALMDLAGIIGVTQKALSLNGELGLAFGARGIPARIAGGSVPAAHYETKGVVINLTKKNGAGSLAHEWFHAVDNYFSRMRGRGGEYLSNAPEVGMASHGSSYAHSEGPLRKEIIEAWGKINKAINESGLKQRSETLDTVRSTPYWGTDIELGARAFEAYIVEKLQDNNASNDYLANIVDEKVWDTLGEATGDKKEYPYPTRQELPLIVAAFDNLFQVVEQRETDTGIALASRKKVAERPSDEKLVRVVDVNPSIIPVDLSDTKGLVAWLRDYYGGSTVSIRDTGEIAKLTNRGLRESAKRRGVAQRQGYAALDTLLEEAVYDGFEAADARHAKKLKGQNVYFSVMRMGDSIYSVRFKMDVPLHGDGLHYKDHKVSEVEMAPTLYQSSEGKGSYTLQNVNAISEVSLSILKGAVNPTSLENGTLTSIAPGQFLPQRRAKALHARVNAVQRVVDALGSKAKNAAPVRVVQAFSELPEHIQNQYADSARDIEGVYDPNTKSVWLVADNISDVGRAAEVWAHEQVVHHGLRGMFSAVERKQVLTQLWTKLGGMSNELISEIAERYGVNPRADAKARESVMEEFLANLAEKKMRNDLTAQEEKWWQRIVDAVLRAWANMVRSVSSNSPSMKAADIDGLLSALGKYVMDGDTQRHSEGEFSPASLRRERQTSEASHAAVDAPLASRKRGAGSVSAMSPSSILEAGIRKAMGIAENSDIRRVMGEEDLGILSRIVSLPHWIAKQFPDFAKVYERQLTRMDERSAALKKSLESVPSVFGGKRLNAEDMSSLRDLIWKFEGQDPVALKGVEKYLVKETLANGREIIAANPDFYIAYKKWLDSVGKGTKAANSAMLEIRKSLDADLALAHNRMASMSEMSDDAIKEFRQSIGHVPNYFPHHRYGTYFVQAKVGKEVVYRKHFDASTEAMAKVMKDKIVNKVRGEFPDAEWAWGKNTRLPDEVLGAPIDSEAMEQIIMAATSKIADKERAREIRETLTAGTADILKARGWNSHGIGRKGIPGFETEDISKILYDYKSGLNGWLTKMEAARDFSAALGKIDAGTSPNLWRYTSQYVKDMLRNSDRVDRITGTIKSVAFAWYLGGSIKTAFVNMTQNMVVGVPRLQMDVTGGGMMWLHGAQKAIVDRVTGNKGKGLTEEEARLVQELYGESVITDAFMEEIRGHLSGVTGATLWNKFMKVLGLPMSEVERFNRASLALAAFRAARSGSFKAKARAKYGVTGRANYEQAKQFAADVVRDAHFVYGKPNMPEFMRSNTAGRMAAPMYTFRTFTHNMLAMWLWALKTQGSEGATFVAKSIGATMALGGVTALPMYATLMAICQALSGDDDDWTEAIRSWLPNNNVLRDVVCYGAPAMGGVNVGGSLKMETPLTKGLTEGKNPQEVLGESIGDIIGIPYDLLVVKPSRMLDAHSKGSAWRTLEEAAPVAIKNGMQAWRLYTEGQTTMTGRPINDPGLPGARKLSASEAFGKALGFQPVSSTKSYDAYAAGKHSDMVRSNKIDEITVLALKTYDSGEPTGRLKMTRKLLEWNDTMRAEGKPHMLINLKDVNRRVKSRRRENRPTAKAMQKKARIDEVWQ